MPVLPENAVLGDYQRYVSELEEERGFSQQNARDKCLLLGEEIRELFKAVRKAEGMGIDANEKVAELEGELADVFIYLCAIANRFDIDLGMAFRRKEAINHTRSWV
ncbi:MazG nucleotide pyrophosphohydrolase domain-containing protein [Chromobacterium violaceum]|uniref:NTP pyrophosphohydrolase MazG-like domain-containing protein n=1 Tax=Chromobacterium violaceum (strain ATCC 12472 / DSM 30191 / JCM 1249 / CCUG 213 / NBRC 12614 / NCIMB 9131 / NCTC 9757 / MK) TaxID=243365 RepID=Q7NYE8_CHRVO|nr:MazG nucleotide pyrophosphohydrolase domain-containing protein [Chromobacterium violaceum]AAQ59001.1 hypothetical protein CV_1326 [Chromobacterium violaceum ATCC 12472]SUX88831.1 MazG nucleotide pyrophosphohydrolase domain [Chromobacterium violaceum]